MGILVANQGTNEGDINRLNEQMRSQPWYQQFFASQGLDPNRVRLNENQRKSLMQLAIANGVQLGSRMKIDSAGNINQQGGFAGMPTWAKVATAAAPVAAAMFIPGVREATLGNLGSIFGAGTAPTAASTASTVASTVAPTAAAAASSMLSGTTLASLAGMGANAFTNIYATNAQRKAAEEAARAQLEASTAAGNLEAQGAAEQLKFLREQEAQRRLEHEQATALNKEQYDRAVQLELDRFNRTYGLEAERVAQEQAKIEEERRKYDELQARLAPYREMGQAAFGRIGSAVMSGGGGFVPPPATVGA